MDSQFTNKYETNVRVAARFVKFSAALSFLLNLFLSSCDDEGVVEVSIKYDITRVLKAVSLRLAYKNLCHLSFSIIGVTLCCAMESEEKAQES